jgi:hypothetical protein
LSADIGIPSEIEEDGEDHPSSSQGGAYNVEGHVHAASTDRHADDHADAHA